MYKGYIYYPKANGQEIIESRKEAARESALEKDGSNSPTKNKLKWQLLF